MFKKVILLFCAVVVCSASMAQVKKKIKKGRRNKSESQFMLEENYFQAEWEVGQETLTDNLNTTVYPNLVMRYGVNKQFEINAEVSLLTARDQASQKKNTSGIEPVVIGANYLLLSETAKRPAIIFSGQLAVPFLATKSFTATYWAPALELIVEKTVSRQVILAASGGAFWDGFSTNASIIYNGSISYNLTKKWALTSEWFGFINGTPQHNTDLALLIHLIKVFNLEQLPVQDFPPQRIKITLPSMVCGAVSLKGKDKMIKTDVYKSSTDASFTDSGVSGTALLNPRNTSV